MTDAELDAALALLRKQKGFCPMTPEEADAAYEAAEPEPLSKDEIDAIVKAATKTSEPPGPDVNRDRTFETGVRCFSHKHMARRRAKTRAGGTAAGRPPPRDASRAGPLWEPAPGAEVAGAFF